MESELGNAAVLGVPRPSGVGPPKDQINAESMVAFHNWSSYGGGRQ